MQNIHYFLLISIFFSLSSCGEKAETKNEIVSKEKTTIKVNWPDSLSEEGTWINGNEVDGYTGSTALGELSEVVDLDSSKLAELEGKYKMENNARGFIPASTIEKYHYPLKSHSAGSVDGFYDSGELIKIASRFGAEFGYSSITVHYQNSEIEKINYHQHFPDYKKFSSDHPDNNGIDPDKLTYTDTTYLFELGAVKSSKKYAGKKNAATKIKEGLIEHLIDCANKMESELSYEREFGEK